VSVVIECDRTRTGTTLLHVDCCQGDRAHYDLGLAREVQRARGGKGDYLILHLSELVRVAFMAATSDSDHLKLEGLKTMEVSLLASGCHF